jgi:hypothetical protein
MGVFCQLGPHARDSPGAVHEETSKSASLAFPLELLLPGAGSIDADHATGALVNWGLMLGGPLLIVKGVTTTRDPETGAEQTDFNDMEFAVGLLMLARISHNDLPGRRSRGLAFALA